MVDSYAYGQYNANSLRRGGWRYTWNQAPDNSAWYADIGGTWNFLSHTTASATASVGKFEQDDDFLPYTINPNLPTNALPRNNLDGEVDVTHFDLRVTSAPWSRIRFTGEYRSDATK